MSKLILAEAIAEIEAGIKTLGTNRPESELHGIKTALKYAISILSRVDPDEDRGWQDKPEETDGVKWQTQTIDSTMIGGLMVAARTEAESGWAWSVWDNEDWDSKPEAEGTAPTRDEARRQAVEAARGMG